MYFRLVDGKPEFATHKLVLPDGNETMFFVGDDIPNDAEKLELPDQTIVNRANSLIRKTLSKSEFEKLLFETTETETIMLAIADLDIQREIDKTETQLAIAELAETILGGAV